MWDDAVQMQGRQTKRKWKLVWMLLAAALLCIMGSWLGMHPEFAAERIAALRERFWTRTDSDWVQITSADNVFAGSGELLLWAEEGGFGVSDPAGQTLYRTDADWQNPVIAAAYGYAALYEPGATNLFLAGENGAMELDIPQGIDLAVPGPDGGGAVITAGSGYFTETRLFSSSGEVYRQIGLTDQAMTMMAFLKNGTLASCCVDTEGSWTLRLDIGEDTLGIPLQASMVYELKPCKDGLALWTSDGISFYSAEGNLTGSYEVRDDAVLDWDCGDWAAIIIRRFGTYRLLTLSPEGKAVEKELDSGLPEKLLVCGNSACMLDSEALLVYDKGGNLVQHNTSGAQAWDMIPATGGLTLIGDAEVLYLQIS